jgi:NPL4 family
VEAYELSQDYLRLVERKLVLNDEEMAKRPVSKWEKRESGAQFVQFADEVYFDRDYRWSLPVECFLVPVSLAFIKIAFETCFPVENRALPCTAADLKQSMDALKDRSFAKRLRDYHLLFFLSSAIGLETVLEMAERIQQDGPIEEGHQLLITMLAES